MAMPHQSADDRCPEDSKEGGGSGSGKGFYVEDGSSQYRIREYSGRVVASEDCTPFKLVGLPASPGKVRGRVRLLRSPEDGERLSQGDVMVAPCVDVGWTPLFLVAGGVVTELGGPLSHASVVAREYGLPAVVNVEGATHRLRDGQLVELDGDSGTVVLIDEG